MPVSRAITVAAVVLLVLVAGEVGAQESVTVRAGETRALASGSQPITVTSPATKGATVVTESTTTPKTYVLLYTAPATTSVFTEAIKYANPTARSVDVTVTPAGSEKVYAEAFKALFVLFVVALLLESGLAVLFNWRPFLVTFDGRGTKTVISVFVAYVFVEHFNLDIVTRLVNVYSEASPPFESRSVGRVLTALVIAGGSAAVNNLLVALGFRSVRTAEQVTPKPPLTDGWISVTLDRKKAKGPVAVLIGDPTAGPPVAGTIRGGAPPWKLLRLFLRDRSRFPTSGGFAVPAGTNCQVELHGNDADGKAVPPTTWGPKKIAAGGIIDLTLPL